MTWNDLVTMAPFAAGVALAMAVLVVDIIATEVLTLAPLGAMVVAFGFFPGLLLDLFRAPVADTLGAVRNAHAIAIDPIVVAIAAGILVAIVAIRFLSLRPDSTTTAVVPAEGALSR